MGLCNSPSKVAIRADGGYGIGMGHIMRTIAIAEALRNQNCDVLYVCANDGPKLELDRLGFESRVLGTRVHDLVSETDAIARVIAADAIDFVFVDSFFASNDYFRLLSQSCGVGSMGLERRFDEGLDLIVSYLDSTDREWYRSVFSDTDTVALIGPQYAPIRAEFQSIVHKPIRDRVDNLLIMSGGTDDLNTCARILENLCHDEYWIDVTKHVIVGEKFKWKKELIECFSVFDDVILHRNISLIGSLMSSCDLAITAGGFSAYELAACGVPMVAYAVSRDQVVNGKIDGAMEWLGDARDESSGLDGSKVHEICSAARALAEDPGRRRTMRNASALLGIDFHGAERIANGISDILDRSKSR